MLFLTRAKFLFIKTDNTFVIIIIFFFAISSSIFPVFSLTAISRTASLAVIIMSVVIPGLVLLTCLIGTIFLCKNRNRIPLFRSKARSHGKPDSKVQIPLSSGQGYPVQPPPQQKSADHEGEIPSGAGSDSLKMEGKKEPLYEVTAVDVNKEFPM